MSKFSRQETTERKRANHEIAKVKEYLSDKGINATEADIVLTAIKVTQRCAGNWTFVCENCAKKQGIETVDKKEAKREWE